MEFTHTIQVKKCVVKDSLQNRFHYITS